MGNEASSFAKPVVADTASLQSLLQWCVQQSARVQYSQALLQQTLTLPLVLPSTSSTDLYQHLSTSAQSLTELIDDLVNNRDRTQRGVTPKDDRILSYSTNHDSNPYLASLGLESSHYTELSLTEFINDTESSTSDRSMIAGKFVLLSQLSMALTQAVVQTMTMIEQRQYLDKRLTGGDYYADHLSLTLSVIDQSLWSLTQSLSLARTMFQSLYRDYQLQSLLHCCHEWIRVLTGLQSVWSKPQGRPYHFPCDSTSAVAKQYNQCQLVGLSLTSTTQTHVAPLTPPLPTPGNADPHAYVDNLVTQLQSRARLLDTALKHNELDSINHWQGWITNDSSRLYTVQPDDMKRASQRLTAVLGLQRRHTLTASDIAMGITNMKHRLSTLTSAIGTLSEIKHRDDGLNAQLDKVVSEAHSEARALRGVYSMFAPQFVLELIQSMESLSLVQSKGCQELKSQLITMSPYTRSMLTLSPPPVPQRHRKPSLTLAEQPQMVVQPVIETQHLMAVVSAPAAATSANSVNVPLISPSTVMGDPEWHAVESPSLAPTDTTVSSVTPTPGHRRSSSWGLLAEAYGVEPQSLTESVPRDTPEFESSVSEQRESLNPVDIVLTTPNQSTKQWWREDYVKEHTGDSPVHVSGTKTEEFCNHFVTVTKLVPHEPPPPPLPTKPNRASWISTNTSPRLQARVLIATPPPAPAPITMTTTVATLNGSMTSSGSSRVHTRSRHSENGSTEFTPSTLASLLPPRSADAAGLTKADELVSPKTSPSSSGILKRSSGSPDQRRRSVTFSNSPSIVGYSMTRDGEAVYFYGSDDDSQRAKSRGMQRAGLEKYECEGDVLKVRHSTPPQPTRYV